MPNTVAKTPAGLPHKCVAARMTAGERAHKPLVDDQNRAVLGACIEAALLASGWTKKDASAEMGYGENQAPLSNWISGKPGETAQFHKLFMLGHEFRVQFALAVARTCESGVSISYVMTVPAKRRQA